MTTHQDNHSKQVEVSAGQLHNESKDWQNKISFWKDETSFLEKIIGKTALNLHEDRTKKDLEHFQNKLIYYRGEVLDTMHHDIQGHESELATLVQEPAAELKAYKDAHNKHTDSLHSFEKEYNTLKKEIFSFVEIKCLIKIRGLIFICC